MQGRGQGLKKPPLWDMVWPKFCTGLSAPHLGKERFPGVGDRVSFNTV